MYIFLKKGCLQNSIGNIQPVSVVKNVIFYFMSILA